MKEKSFFATQNQVSAKEPCLRAGPGPGRAGWLAGLAGWAGWLAGWLAGWAGWAGWLARSGGTRSRKISIVGLTRNRQCR
ncbi:hypothetical protein DYH09_08510 [bacterium CPR1]|nr:hypothetical protein [bacterium CPR1]